MTANAETDPPSVKREALSSIPRRQSYLRHLMGVACLLFIHLLLAYTSLTQKSVTFDEILHISGGVGILRYGDYRIQPENGLLPQYLSGLPLSLNSKVKMADPAKAITPQHDRWTMARDFFFGGKNDADKMLRHARTAMLIITVLLGLTVFWLSKRLFGYHGAYLSLAVYAISPTILANCRLVTSDMTLSLFLILTSVAVWRVLQTLTPIRILFLMVSASLLFLSKVSAVLILPIALILTVCRLLSPAPIVLVYKNRTLHFRRLSQKLGVLAAAGILTGLAIFISLWIAYGLRYSMLDNETEGRRLQNQEWQKVLQGDDLIIKSIAMAREWKILPESYLYGFAHVVSHSRKRIAFLNGEIRNTGWWYFFPYCAWVKTPIPVMLMGLITIVLLLKRLLKKRLGPKTIFNYLVRRDLPVLPLAVLVIVYLGFSIASNLNIGFRHILVCYPVWFILCGGITLGLNRKTRLRTATVAILLLWLLWTCLAIHPDYLSYFNSLDGGPKQGYRHLVDSSFDWGQDLRQFKSWLEKRKASDPEAPVYLSYFGSAVPQYYRLDVTYLPCFIENHIPQDVSYRPGWYAISATMLQQVYSSRFAQWNPKLEKDLFFCKQNIGKIEAQLKTNKDPKETSRLSMLLIQHRQLEQHLKLAKLCYYLRHRQPDDRAGYSILIYKVSQSELDNLFPNLLTK